MNRRPGSPKEARRLERLKRGSRAARDTAPARIAPARQTAPARRQSAHRPRPVLGNIEAATSDEPTIVVSKRAVERLHQGHVWIYRSDIAAPETLPGGEIVRLTDERGLNTEPRRPATASLVRAPSRIPWAALLSRVFKVDVLKCGQAGDDGSQS